MRKEIGIEFSCDFEMTIGGKSIADVGSTSILRVAEGK